MTVRVFGISLLPPGARKPRALAAAARRALRACRSDGQGELNVVFLDRRRMRALNKRYLRKDRDTDVIAFNYDAAPGARKARAPYGDVFISAHQARVQAEELGHPVLAEVLTLAVHGTLHLAGCDDSTPTKKALMFRKQERLLAGLLPAKA